jgi:hypothetical protein
MFLGGEIAVQNKWAKWLITTTVFATLMGLPATGTGARGEKHHTLAEDAGHNNLEDMLATGITERVSVASDGTQGNNNSIYSSISANGRYAAFESHASNLVPEDTNGGLDIFVHDRNKRKTELVSVASDGTQGNSNSNYPSISDDGRYVAFTSWADNLVSGDTNGSSDIFVHDRQTGNTQRVSVRSNGGQADGYSYYGVISPDGRYVTFASNATNLVSGDSNDREDIFVHDIQTGETQLVSIASDGTQANDDSFYPSISTGGLYVAFASDANSLVSEDTNNERDVFVHDLQTGQTERVSVAGDGTQGNEPSEWASISGNGRYVAFYSGANNLVSEDTNGWADIFLHDRDTGETDLVSVASDGTQADYYSAMRPSISTDGCCVAFSSWASNLVAEDTNSALDVFVHEQSTGHTKRVSIASDGSQANSWSEFPAISANGRYVIFDSNATNLVFCEAAGDTNERRDVFVHDRFGELSTISGNVVYTDYTPFPEVTISTDAGHTTTTDSAGDYLLDNICPATYTVTPSKSGYAFSPTSRQITVPPNATHQDFTGIQLSYSFLPCISQQYCAQGFFDDFSDPTSGWPIQEDGYALFEYLEGEYRILVKNTNWWAGAVPTFQAKDFLVGVKVRNAGTTYGTYGIIFGAAEDWNYFYTFEIDPEGFYGVWRFSYDRGWVLLVDDFSTHINQGSDSNRIEVKRVGSSIEVYANQQLLTTLSDNTYTGLGYAGLITSSFNYSPVDARFDNFSVYPVECWATSTNSTSPGLTNEASGMKSGLFKHLKSDKDSIR